MDETAIAMQYDTVVIAYFVNSWFDPDYILKGLSRTSDLLELRTNMTEEAAPERKDSPASRMSVPSVKLRPRLTFRDLLRALGDALSVPTSW